MDPAAIAEQIEDDVLNSLMLLVLKSGIQAEPMLAGLARAAAVAIVGFDAVTGEATFRQHLEACLVAARQRMVTDLDPAMLSDGR